MQDRSPKVAVLMSTYNGERFLREQLDSIFNQREVDLSLYVRDDGSTDRTLDILDEFAQNHRVVILNDGERVGPGESFMRLVCKYAHEPGIEYYAFADQDDIWFDDKIIAAIEKIEENRSEDPILYTSNQLLWIDGESRGTRHYTKQSVELIPHMTYNTIAGCTFVMNQALAELITSAGIPDSKVIKYRLHDAWILLVAIVNGSVLYDEEPYMYYRLHNDNVVGMKEMTLFRRIGRIKRFLVKSEDVNLRMKTAQELLRLYPNMHYQDKRILELYANYRNSWRDKKKLAFSKEIRTNCGEKPGIFTLKVLLGVV